MTTKMMHEKIIKMEAAIQLALRDWFGEYVGSLDVATVLQEAIT